MQPSADDPVFSDRPLPSRDFSVPMECVGDLLMVWDFCTSFSRTLHLWPFSLEDFENVVCHKESNLALIVESHSALVRLLIKDNRKHFWHMKNKKRKVGQTFHSSRKCILLRFSLCGSFFILIIDIVSSDPSWKCSCARSDA